MLYFNKNKAFFLNSLNYTIISRRWLINNLLQPEIHFKHYPLGINRHIVRPEMMKLIFVKRE